MRFFELNDYVMHSTAECAACTGLQAFCNVSAMHRNAPRSVCLSVCLHPGKTAEWIGTWLGMVVGVELCVGVLDFGGDRRRERDSSVGEFGALHGC